MFVYLNLIPSILEVSPLSFSLIIQFSVEMMNDEWGCSGCSALWLLCCVGIKLACSRMLSVNLWHSSAAFWTESFRLFLDGVRCFRILATYERNKLWRVGSLTANLFLSTWELGSIESHHIQVTGTWPAKSSRGANDDFAVSPHSFWQWKLDHACGSLIQ